MIHCVRFGGLRAHHLTTFPVPSSRPYFAGWLVVAHVSRCTTGIDFIAQTINSLISHAGSFVSLERLAKHKTRVLTVRDRKTCNVLWQSGQPALDLHKLDVVVK